MANHQNGAGTVECTDHEPGVSGDKRTAVRRQLETVLADPLFKHSKRCSDFLKFAVLRALDDTTEAIKERTLGVELFGRQPDYDTSVDPIVRVTAAEVRKRLHHYYHAFGRDSEIRIDFPKGSYVPEFRVPQNLTGHNPAESVNDNAQGGKQARYRKWLTPLLVAIPALALCVFLLGATRQNTLDRFWSPIAKQAVTLCVPARDVLTDPAAPTDPAGIEALHKEITGFGRPSRVTLSDSIALSMISGVVRSTGARLQFRASKDANMEDLKEGPIVSIGAFSNRWTQRFQGGRFRFLHDGAVHYIADSRNPSSRAWAIEDGDAQIGVDYGLVSRTMNPTTGTYFVTIAGIHGFGTEAAAQCAADTACLDSAARMAPGDWKRTNIQIVVQTTVVDQIPGVPKVLAAYLW